MATPIRLVWARAIFDVTRPFGQDSTSEVRSKVINRSPKGNMWSAIPIALLYSGPEGDKVLQNTGDFCSFICSFVHPFIHPP